MKNKDKFDLRKINFYDIIEKDIRYLYILNNSEKVAKIQVDDNTTFTTLFKWLESEYKEYNPDKSTVKSRKIKEKLIVPDINFNVNEITKVVDDSIEKSKKKARSERRKAKKVKAL